MCARTCDESMFAVGTPEMRADLWHLVTQDDSFSQRHFVNRPRHVEARDLGVLSSRRVGVERGEHLRRMGGCGSVREGLG